jgi:hypothetical protein
MITFIIPSLSRITLKNTLLSLVSLEDEDWKAIVNYDGIENPNRPIKDDRIRYFKNEKVRKYGGIIRNEAVKKAETEWVAFVDDDDAVEKNYICAFKEELNNNPDADCIVFRMLKRKRIIPRMSAKEPKDVHRGDIGISFCVKKNIFEKLKFNPCSTEDYKLFFDLLNNNYKIILSDHCVYRVRPDKEFLNQLKNRKKLIKIL